MQRRRLVHAGAWTLATGAAVTLSWWGVHTVLAGTAYDPPRALPVSDGPSQTAEPEVSSTHRPKPSSPSPTPSKPATGHSESSRAPSSDGGKKDGTPTPRSSRDSGKNKASASGSVRGEAVKGGRAVFDMRAHSASLVSATPNAGHDMQIWKTPEWIRVTFTSGDGGSSTLFCRWDNGAPHIEKFDG
ncbi:hypothetical protein [Streptomyces sp. ODS28]|uniref:hypothetical protein n=1 Tax=Streptomyces sp. ODS28 TaxID=3136688 RepID=UPI0031EABEC3